MPELPDIEADMTALRRTIGGETIRNVRLRSIFLVRSIDPPFDWLNGATVVEFRRIAKRIVFALEPPDARFWMVLHLLFAGRLHWAKSGAGLPGKTGLCAFDFDHGSLALTEASKKRRSSIHLVGRESELEEVRAQAVFLKSHDPTPLIRPDQSSDPGLSAR